MQLPGAHFSPKFKQEIKLSGSNNQKCLIFSQKKAFVIFQEMEIWKKKFFIFQEWTLKSQAKKFSYFLRFSKTNTFSIIIFIRITTINLYVFNEIIFFYKNFRIIVFIFSKLNQSILLVHINIESLLLCWLFSSAFRYFSQYLSSLLNLLLIFLTDISQPYIEKKLFLFLWIIKYVYFHQNI